MARAKFSLQAAVGLALGAGVIAASSRGRLRILDADLIPVAATELSFPFLKALTPDLALAYVPFVLLVIVGSANAVNLTDGLDGLAIGAVGVAALTFALLTYAVGHARIAGYLGIPFVSGVSELSIFCVLSSTFRNAARIARNSLVFGSPAAL